MAKRNILNHLGEVVGELELPDSTSEEVWQKRLAPYARVPESAKKPDLTPRQVRQALILLGYSLQQIEDAIAQLPEPQRSLAQVEWEYSVAFVRTNPLIAQVAQILQWSPEQLDSMWDFARTL